MKLIGFRVQVLVAVLAATVTSVGPARAEETHPLFRIALQDNPLQPQPAVAPVEEGKPSAREADDTPVYKTWWFWTLAAVVVGGTVIVGVATAGDPDAKRPRPCMPTFLSCFGDGR